MADQSLTPPFGSAALYHRNSLGDIALTRDDRSAFDLLSISLAELPGGDDLGRPINGGPFDLTFYGLRANGESVEQTVTVGGFLTLKPYALGVFRDVVLVQWRQGGGPPIGPAHQFDDIVLSDPSGVPLPKSWVAGVVLLSGLVWSAG